MTTYRTDLIDMDYGHSVEAIECDYKPLGCITDEFGNSVTITTRFEMQPVMGMYEGVLNKHGRVSRIVAASFRPMRERTVRADNESKIIQENLTVEFGTQRHMLMVQMYKLLLNLGYCIASDTSNYLDRRAVWDELAQSAQYVVEVWDTNGPLLDDNYNIVLYNNCTDFWTIPVVEHTRDFILVIRAR